MLLHHKYHIVPVNLIVCNQHCALSIREAENRTLLYILKITTIYTNLTKVRWRSGSYGKNNNSLTRFPKFSLYFFPDRIFQKIQVNFYYCTPSEF